MRFRHPDWEDLLSPVTLVISGSVGKAKPVESRSQPRCSAILDLVICAMFWLPDIRDQYYGTEKQDRILSTWIVHDSLGTAVDSISTHVVLNDMRLYLYSARRLQQLVFY